jgi:hypothetical protein
MKKLFISLLASMLAISLTCAQDHLFLEEQEYQLEGTRFSAWVFPVAHNLDLALEDLQAYCKDHGDVKLTKKMLANRVINSFFMKKDFG